MPEQNLWQTLSEENKQQLAKLVLDDICTETFSLLCDDEPQIFVELLDQVLLKSEASCSRRLLSFLLSASDLNMHLTGLLSIINEEALYNDIQGETE